MDMPVQNSQSIIERAFELARSGRCHNVAEVSAKLKQERYESVEAHLAGPSIRKELRRICAEASRNEPPAPAVKAQ
jgi:hypothetical protein